MQRYFLTRVLLNKRRETMGMKCIIGTFLYKTEINALEHFIFVGLEIFHAETKTNINLFLL